MGFRTEELIGIGDTTLSGNTEVHGGLTVHDDVDFLGQLEISGELYVDGMVTFTGSTIIGGSLDVNCISNFNNGIVINGGWVTSSQGLFVKDSPVGEECGIDNSGTVLINGHSIGYTNGFSLDGAVGISGSFYASTTPGGSPDTLFTFVNGILVENQS